MKCIPICTPAGGIVNVIRDGDNGFLTNDFTVDSFVDKLTEALLLSEDKRKQIREKGYQDYVTLYSMKTCAKKYEELYRKLLTKF